VVGRLPTRENHTFGQVVSRARDREDGHVDVTAIQPVGHANVTGGINWPLFEQALAAYADQLELPYDTVEDRMTLLGLKHPTEYQRLREGCVPLLHKGCKIARRLGLDPLELWPPSGARDRRNLVAA